MPWFSKEQLESKQPGLSGGDKIGVPPVEGVNNADGTPATTVMQMLRALIRRGSATAQELLESLKTVDGASSGLDADLLDGLDSTGYVKQTEKGQPGGTGTLDANGKQPISQVNAALLGANRRQGTWDAATDTPSLGAMTLDPVQDLGKFWEVSVAGNRLLPGEPQADWNAGDYAIWEGTGWGKIDNTDRVGSVEGRTGAVTLGDLYAGLNDPRLRTIRDEGAALTNRPLMDFTGDGVIVSDDPVGGRTQVNISGAAAGAASRTAAGITEYADADEAKEPLRQDRAIDPAGLQAEITRRLTPEAVRVVGAAGEPAFQNGWVNSGGSNETVAFYKDPLGRVHLRGSASSGTLNAVAFTLPLGYRPAADLLFVGAGAGLNSPSRIAVSSTGTVTLNVGSGSVVHLNNVSFRAA